MSAGQSGRHRAPAHALVAGAFCLFAIFLTWPLATQLTTHIPGATADDNVVFVWNFWWMRQALAATGAWFQTDLIFHPVGANLVLHTHTAFNAVAGATIFAGLSPAAALNATILCSAALNGFCAYLLAYRQSAHRAASILAGGFFASTASLFDHLGGHFNYYSAWGLPLFAWVFLEALARPARLWRIAGAGVVLGAIAYLDAYYFVYAVVFATLVLAERWLQPRLVWLPAPAVVTMIDRLLLSVGIAAVAAATTIAITGGGVVTIASTTIAFTTGLNLRAAAVAAALIWAWRRRRPRLRLTFASASWRPDLVVMTGALSVAAICALPLVLAAFELWRNGDYASQHYQWRNAPAGIDLGGFVLGSPWSRIWSILGTGPYALTRLDASNGVAWIGAGGVIVILLRKSLRHMPDLRLWLLVIGVFAIWALGPWLAIFGVNTGLPLPQILMRYVPILSNARIPAHATIMVLVAITPLLAHVLARSTIRRSPLLLAATAAAILIDGWSIPLRTFALDAPAIYQDLARRPAGALLELPLGLRDGFGEEGRIDPRVMYYQSIHHKPMTGGYMSRVSPATRERYHASHALHTLLTLSNADPADDTAFDPRQILTELRSLGIAYIVVNTDQTSAQTNRYLGSLGLRLLMTDRAHQLYGVH